MPDAFGRADVDRLGEAMRRRDLSDDEVDFYNRYRDSFIPALAAVLGTLQDLGAPPATERQKTIWSTVAKLRRSTARLSQVQDIAGCRVVVALKHEQDVLVDRLRNANPTWRLLDRRTRPSHGYRAVHLIGSAAGRHVEVQIRTELQHLWAEVSEAADRVFPGVKYGAGRPEVLRALHVLSDLVAELEGAEGRMADDLLREQRAGTRALLTEALSILAVDLPHSDSPA